MPRFRSPPQVSAVDPTGMRLNDKQAEGVSGGRGGRQGAAAVQKV